MNSEAILRHADELEKQHGFSRQVCERMAYDRKLAEMETLCESWREKLMAETKLHNAACVRIRELEAQLAAPNVQDQRRLGRDAERT
jgi:hypothetical protein